MFIFTSEERKVIIFLISVALLGIGINFFSRRYPVVKRQVLLNPDIAKINLNTADYDLLRSVSGIGEKIAQRIIEYRNTQGVFKEIEELKNIKGVSPSRYEKIKGSFILKP